MYYMYFSRMQKGLGVPEKEQKQTKTSGHFPDLKLFSSTNVLMI
jgi:hypothetical protein